MPKANDKPLKSIAYFSMEVGLANNLPTYSGGLGVLAGDTLKSAADGELPLVGMTLLYRKGYFKQTIDSSGQQHEESVSWNVADVLTKESVTSFVTIEGRKVFFQVWRYDVKGARGHVVPVYFLDTDLKENDPYDRSLTDSLYGGDERYRLCQEVLLGEGGIAALKGLYHEQGLASFKSYHMNEGHAALLTIALVREELQNVPLEKAQKSDLEAVRRKCVFTTHTPVPAGHDRFNVALTGKVLGKETLEFLQRTEITTGDELNMTHLALYFARYVNGVAKRHGEVSRQMFPGHKIDAITNGVHLASWVSKPVASLFDKYIPGWQADNHYVRYACEIPLDEIKAAHTAAKQSLLAEINARTGQQWQENVFTIGFARRAATYKRADLLFDDPQQLANLTKKFGPLQVVYAGKAHPMDEGGKRLIANVVKRSKELGGDQLRVVYLENYDMELGRLITGGVDVWLNNPVKPLEASGTSGMKAAVSGVPSLSTLDGWWVEGCVEGVTGWEIHDSHDGMRSGVEPADPKVRKEASEGLYAKLADTVLPLYYELPEGYLEVRRHAMALNGSYFSTQRMVEQYRCQAYRV